jgi:HSP20 family protein
MSLPNLRKPAATRGPDHSRDLEEVYDQIGRWMTSVFDDANDVFQTWSPLGDVIETPDAYLVEVDLPGVKRDDIDIEFDGRELRITGELKEKEREGLFRRRTRRIGRFEYRTTLPPGTQANEDAVEATLDDGVLTVRIPKDEAAKPRRIKIHGG